MIFLRSFKVIWWLMIWVYFLRLGQVIWWSLVGELVLFLTNLNTIDELVKCTAGCLRGRLPPGVAVASSSPIVLAVGMLSDQLEPIKTYRDKLVSFCVTGDMASPGVAAQPVQSQPLRWHGWLTNVSMVKIHPIFWQPLCDDQLALLRGLASGLPQLWIGQHDNVTLDRFDWDLFAE